MSSVTLSASNNPEQLWAAAQQMLKFEVTTQQFLAYVTLIRADASKTDTLHLLAPSETIASWARNNLAKRLEELVGKPHKCQITIQVDHADNLFDTLVSNPKQTPKAVVNLGARPTRQAGVACRTRNNSQALTGLSPDSVFANFVKGPSNAMAYAAGFKLTSEPNTARTTSPLFIHGAVGLGKTHLAHAIGNRFLEKNPTARLRVLSGEQFMREVQTTFLTNKIQSFRERFRRLDILILDDIHLIGRDSEQTHKQFLALFNYMSERNLPIIITSDRTVRALHRNLPSPLLSRVAMGVDVVIATPDLDTRISILRSQSKTLLGRELPLDTARILAASLRNNCRELIGALRRLAHHADFKSTALTPEIANLVLKESSPVPYIVSPQEILKRTSSHFNVRLADLQSKKRSQLFVKARHSAMYLCRVLTQISLPEIGALFNCHHSSVVHACRKIEKKQQSDQDFAFELNVLRQDLTS